MDHSKCFLYGAFAALAALPLCAQDEGKPGSLGVYRSTIGDLREPAACAFGPDGKLFVVESDLDRVSVFDASGARVASFGKPGSGDGELLDPRGIDVGDDGIVYVADSGNHRVLKFALDGKFVGAIGSYGIELGQFRDPRGLVLCDGKLYVADTGNDRVQVLSAEAEPLSIGAFGNDDGEFVQPTDVAVDDSGAIYVVDSLNHRVEKFDEQLHFVKAWGDFGPHPGFFAVPTSIDFSAGLLYVVDSDNHRVQVFERDGTRPYEWGLHALKPREGEGKLHYPCDVAVSRDGTLAAIAEAFEDRVQLFGRAQPGEAPPENLPVERIVSSHYGPSVSVQRGLMAVLEPGAPSVLLYDLEHDVEPWEPINITTYSNWGRKFGQLLWPVAAQLDIAKNQLYVIDAGNRTLLQFKFAHDEKSELKVDPYLLKLGRSASLFTPREQLAGAVHITPTALGVRAGEDGVEIFVVDAVSRAVFRFSADLRIKGRLDGGETSRFMRPIDVAFWNENLLVLDDLESCVHVMNRGGTKLRQFGSRGSGDGQFARPGGIAVAPDGSIYISDRALDCVQKFDASGKFLARLGSPGLGGVQFHKPRGLSVDAAGRLYVLDWGNHRGQVLTSDGEFIAAFGSRAFTKLAARKK